MKGSSNATCSDKNREDFDMATASIDKKIESFTSKWESHTFSNGSYPGEDYLDFQK